MIENNPLKATEQNGVFGLRTTLVFDTAAQSQHRGLPQHLRNEFWVASTQSCENRWLEFAGSHAGPVNCVVHAQPGGAVPEDFLHQRDVVLGIAAMSAGEPLRTRQAVAGLPTAQRCRRHVGALRQLANGQGRGCRVRLLADRFLLILQR